MASEAGMTDSERRRIWSQVSVDRRTGTINSRISEHLSTIRGQKSLAAVAKISIANAAQAECEPAVEPATAKVAR